MLARWYQTEAVNALFNYFERNDGNPIIALPTGSGKSYVISMFLYSVLFHYPNQRIIVGTHVKELVQQDFDDFISIWPDAPAGVFSAGLGRKDMFQPITFAGIASIVNVIDIFGHIDLLIIDECHLLGPNADGMYMRLIAQLRLKNPKLKVIGLTATAWRTGMGLLTNGDIFTDIVYDICNIPGFKRLFADGHLVPPRAKRTDTEFDFGGVKIVNGDFSKSGMNEVSAHAETTWKALNESLNKNPDRICRLVFCTGIDHSLLAADMLRHLGLRVAAVHSKMSAKDRDDIILAYRNGELDALTNNGIATTGLNIKQIDHIVMLRGTMSVGLWVQMLGRGTRPYETDGYIKSDCIVSDHAGNARRLGPIDDPFIPKLKGKSAGDAPVKICPACDTYNHASARICDYCGEPFQIKVGYKASAYEDVLVRSDMPVFETFSVFHVFYTQHIKREAKPTDKPSLKATYNCGVRSFIEFIPIETFRKRASDWWRQRFQGSESVPETVSAAMNLIDKLAQPKTITVWVNKKYPEITSYGY